MLRVEELTNTNMSKAKAASKDLTSYRHLVQELNRASRKQAELQDFCKDKLLMNVNYNLTIPQLMREAMIKIYVVSQPEPADPLGFGKHAALSYSEVKNKHPQYCEWAITTAREGPCDPRLKRFARFAGWLSNDPQLVQTASQEWELKMTQSEENHRVVTPKPPTPKQKTMMRSSASSSAEEEIGSVTIAGYQLQSLVSTIEDLKEEVSILKGERPRKKAQNEEALSVVSDFSMVAPRTPARQFERASQAVVPQIFESLVSTNRAVLLEVVNLPCRCDPTYRHGVFFFRNWITGRKNWKHVKLRPKVSLRTGRMLGNQRSVYVTFGVYAYGRVANSRDERKEEEQIMKTGVASQFMLVIDEGSFRSEAVETYCDKHSIYLDVVPADAHWHIGVCEQAIKGVKHLMDRLCADDDRLGTREALALAIETFNCREQIRGFTPVQHAFGRNPDVTGRLINRPDQVPDELLVESADADFERSAHARASAEKALADWQAQQRINRAMNSRSRPAYDYAPGELVFFWRILATETKRDKDGTPGPGSTELLESLAHSTGQESTPWTFNRVVEEIGGNRFEDISSEAPDVREWARAQDPDQEMPPSRFRVRGKRAEPEGVDEEQLPQSTSEPSASSRPVRPRTRGPQALLEEPGQAWWSNIEPDHFGSFCGFWTDEANAIEIEIAMPESKNGRQKASEHLGSYFVGALKRQAVEVNERRLNEQDKQAFKDAKSIEVKNFIASQAFEALPPEYKPDRSQAIGMRWVLTWKLRDDGSRKAKARAVLLGYQDPAYEHRATTAPVMCRQARQLLLQVAANRQWSVFKGDVSGAFLQGRDYPDQLLCAPWDEICEAMNLPRQTIVRLRKACYGLVDAPLEWYKTVATFLSELGFQRLWSDACTWTLRSSEDQLLGVISGHVDDFLFTGEETNAQWRDAIQKIQSRFKWGDWDKDDFVRYVEAIPEIPVNSEALGMYAWVDAASQNRVDGGSSQGILVGLGPLSMLRGEVGSVSIIAWHANKIDRKCRSPGAAETQAAVNGENVLYFARYHWDELIHGSPNPRDPDASVRRIPGTLITDSRNVYDKLQTEVLTIKGAEKKSNIELVSVKESQYRTSLQIRWVHSEAQLANSLTKWNGGHELELFYKMRSSWRIVEDPEMKSARRRKAEGLSPLQQQQQQQLAQSSVTSVESSQMGEAAYLLESEHNWLDELLSFESPQRR
ncbi:RE1 [Symbiodinium sp. KB8]|nr:RE1 [Symbiodinium sp. KB8]